MVEIKNQDRFAAMTERKMEIGIYQKRLSSINKLVGNLQRESARLKEGLKVLETRYKEHKKEVLMAERIKDGFAIREI